MAAILTVLGYSIYDTIIIFDRIRENVPLMRRASFRVIGNVSLWEVLPRSLATTFITLLPVASLYFFGGDTLKDFAFALLVGIGFGAYSSIFLAAPLVAVLKEREPEFARRRDDLGALEGVESVGGMLARRARRRRRGTRRRRRRRSTRRAPRGPAPTPAPLRRPPGRRPDGEVEARAPPAAARVEAAWPSALAPTAGRSRRWRSPGSAPSRSEQTARRSSPTSSRSASASTRTRSAPCVVDVLESWRRELRRLGDSSSEAASRVGAELGIASRDAVDELELRVAQLEHRLRLLERAE